MHSENFCQLLIEALNVVFSFARSLRLPCTYQTDYFVEILIFRLMYRSKHELSSKKILKNIK